MEQILSNLRIIEGKIIQLQEEGREEEVKAWKEAAKTEISRLKTHFEKLWKPLTPMAQLYKNGLELQG